MARDQDAPPNVRQVVPRDAIPSVDDPSFVESYGGSPDDEVVALEVGGDARSYPVRYSTTTRS